MALDAVASLSMAQVSGHLPAGADLDEFRRQADALSAETDWYIYYEKVQSRLNELDVDMLRRCGPRLADVVAGRADGRDVLFTGEGYALLQQFYREAPAPAYYNALIAKLVGNFASTFD